jgi:hypothetical protein
MLSEFINDAILEHSFERVAYLDEGYKNLQFYKKELGKVRISRSFLPKLTR